MTDIDPSLYWEVVCTDDACTEFNIAKKVGNGQPQPLCGACNQDTTKKES